MKSNLKQAESYRNYKYYLQRIMRHNLNKTIKIMSITLSGIVTYSKKMRRGVYICWETVSDIKLRIKNKMNRMKS